LRGSGGGFAWAKQDEDSLTDLWPLATLTWKHLGINEYPAFNYRQGLLIVNHCTGVRLKPWKQGNKMSSVTTIHGLLSNTIWLFFLALGLWGIFRAIRKQGVDGSYLGAMVIGQVIYYVQGVLGLILWIGGHLPAVARPPMHILYGAFALVFLPFVYFTWLKGDDSNRAQWVLAFSTLFLFGIALRAVGTVVG